MAKSREKQLAREMRREGKSIREIASVLSISRSSASIWCRDVSLTKSQIAALIEKDRVGGEKGRMVAASLAKQRKNERVLRNKSRGYARVGDISNRELFLIGVSLYWAEGSKSTQSERFSFVNSDPNMINIMLRWLQECMLIDIKDIVCRVGINEIHIERIKMVEEYWSSITNIPLSQFKKASIKKVVNKKSYENFNRHYGTLCLIVKKGTKLLYEMLGSIDGLSNISNITDSCGKMRSLEAG